MLMRLVEATAATSADVTSERHLRPLVLESSARLASKADEIADIAGTASFDADTVRTAVAAAKLECAFAPRSEVAAKSGNVVCFVVKPDRRPVAVVLPAAMKVSNAALSRAVNVSRSRIATATAGECVSLFGYAPGMLPPIGLRPNVEIFLSSTMLSAGDMSFSAGDGATKLVVDAAALVDLYGEARLLADVERPLPQVANLIGNIVRGGVPPRFICDTMLGRLAQKLRGLDVDAEVVGGGWKEGVKRQVDEDELRRLLRDSPASVALTSSASTATNLQGAIYMLRGHSVEEQAREVIMVFGLDADTRVEQALDRRCCACNGHLVDVDREQVKGDVSEQTRKAYETFQICRREGCQKVFWHGAVYEEGVRDLRRMVEDLIFPFAETST